MILRDSGAQSCSSKEIMEVLSGMEVKGNLRSNLVLLEMKLRQTQREWRRCSEKSTISMLNE